MSAVPVITASYDGAPADHKLEHDAKRDVDHKHKWKLGDWSEVKGGKPRPFHKQRQSHKRLERLYYDNKLCPHTSVQARIAAHKHPAAVVAPDVTVSHSPSNIAPYSSSNSSNETVERDYDCAIPPDADITYSFDAPRGPSNGTDVLGQAMSKAMTRFEDQRTLRLVRDEYDFVKEEEDEREDGMRSPVYEEEFEVVRRFEA